MILVSTSEEGFGTFPAIIAYDVVMKSEPEMIEGPDAFRQVDEAVSRLLTVPKSVLLEREAAYKKRAALNANKRGPKPKQSSVSPVPDGELRP